MKSLRFLSGLFLVVVMLLPAMAVYAGSDSVRIKKSDDAKSVTKGEIRIRLNSDYCKIMIDGEEWEDQEFYNNGKAVALYGIDRTQEHSVTLTPAYPNLTSVTIKIKPKMWKIVRFKRGIKVWRVTKMVRFKKKSGKKGKK